MELSESSKIICSFPRLLYWSLQPLFLHTISYLASYPDKMAANQQNLVPNEGALGSLISNVRSMIQQELDVKEIPSIALSITHEYKRVYTEGMCPIQRLNSPIPHKCFLYHCFSALFPFLCSCQVILIFHLYI
jgi:hypothetical protein